MKDCTEAKRDLHPDPVNSAVVVVRTMEGRKSYPHGFGPLELWSAPGRTTRPGVSDQVGSKLLLGRLCSALRASQALILLAGQGLLRLGQRQDGGGRQVQRLVGARGDGPADERGHDE